MPCWVLPGANAPAGCSPDDFPPWKMASCYSCTLPDDGGWERVQDQGERPLALEVVRTQRGQTTFEVQQWRLLVERT